MKRILFAFLVVALFSMGIIALAQESKESKLTAAEKNELISCFKDQYQKNIPYRNEGYSENIAFFERIANSQDLTQVQKKWQ